MKTILVDAINGLILENGTVYQAMYELLETYPNPKLVLTGANDEQWQKFNLDDSPYEVFTLRHDPEKTDPLYYQILLEKYGLAPEETVYFEHNETAAAVAGSLGIKTYFYNHIEQNLDELKTFLDSNLTN